MPPVTLLPMKERPLHERPVHIYRWQNLRALMGDHHGSVTDTANRLGKSQGQVSAFGGERPIRNIGDDIASEIESAFGKPHGWLDHAHHIVNEDDVKDSGTGADSVRQSAYPAPEIIVVAEKWVRFEEASSRSEYPPMRRAERLIALCKLVEEDGGSLSPEHSESIIKSARARQHQGVVDGRGTATQGTDAD